MLAFIIFVLIFGTLSIIYVLFPRESYVEGFRIIRHMMITRKTHKKYENRID